jgi:hypothetical protein
MDKNQDTSIIGRDADAADGRARDGAEIAEQLNATTSEDAGGSVSGTGPIDEDDELEILFEPERPEDRLH